jgi:hypothetical protein
LGSEPLSTSHRRLNSTMIYARVHDRTVAEDYYAAMEQLEKRKDMARQAEDSVGPTVNESERAQLLALATQLAEPELGVGSRLDLADQMCQVLNHRTPLTEKQSMRKENGRRPRAPPQPSPAFPWAKTALHKSYILPND